LVQRVGARPTRTVLLRAGNALIGKVLLHSSGAHTGFLGCYRSLASTSQSKSPGGYLARKRACEFSYANPLSRFGVTRIDDQIDFGAKRSGPSNSIVGTNWNADFFNSLRFNFY